MEWLLQPLDTLFFRGPQSFEAGESVFLPSQFPPLPATTQGFVRAALLETFCRDVPAYARGHCDRCPTREECTIPEVIGDSPRVGTRQGLLSIVGPYLVRCEGDAAARYFPTPRDLVCSPVDGQEEWEPKAVGVGHESVTCDLGKVRLPEALSHAVPADWISEDGLAAYLRGGSVSRHHLLSTDDILSSEHKVGIAQDRTTKKPIDEMLYAIAMVRMRRQFRLGLTLTGLPDGWGAEASRGLRKLGGEGRMVLAESDAEAATPFHRLSTLTSENDGFHKFRLVFLQPANFGGSWLPVGFKPETDGQGTTTWRGTVSVRQDEIPLRVISACTPKPQPVGGWDLANRRRRPTLPCVAAGSVFYCQCEADPLVFHNSKVGQDTQHGYGHVVVGVWNDGT